MPDFVRATARRLLPALSAVSVFSGAALAEAPKPDFRNLGLGLKAADIDVSEYDGFYCGSNGDAPLARVTGFVDYMKCAPNADGLHEVTVTFGTKLGREAEMFKEQYGEELWTQKYSGTRVANFPVVMSLLFDDQGISRGFRAVTDARADVDDRSRSYLLRYRVKTLYGDDGWDCTEHPQTADRTPVGEEFLDETCSKTLPGKRIYLVGHIYRRPGETGEDSKGNFIPGQFESETRWEVWDPTLPPQASEKVDE